jgi:hypothetical protein
MANEQRQKEYDIYTVILNKSNIVAGTSNSVLQYKFNSSIEFKDSTVTLSALNLYNSWFNISAALSNNQFSYKWFNSAGVLNQTYTITFQDGYYSVNDMNEYVQSQLVSRGHYLQHTVDSNYVYHIEFVTNSSYYAIQMNTYAMRTSDVNYTRGVSSNTVLYPAWGWPSEYTCVQVILPSTNKFYQLVGISPGTYPTVSDELNHSFLSTITPQMDPVSSLMIQCSLVNQGGFSDPSDIIYSFTNNGVPFGGMIDRQVNRDMFCRIRDGIYQSFTLKITDQNYNRVEIRDPAIVIMLNFRIPRAVV